MTDTPSEKSAIDVSMGAVKTYDANGPAERALRKKFDTRVMPLVSLMYAMAFLDRVNVGFASLAGMQKNIGLVGNQYNIGLMCFYISYIAIEAPSNLLGKHYGMGRWLAGCTLGFGLILMCTAFIRNFGEFAALRFLLGIFEGGMLPGIAWFLSKFYRRQELTYRMAVVLAVSNIGTSFGGLLASAILKIKHIGWLTTWRNIFLIEGIVTMAVGFAAFFFIVDGPEKASWLTAEEKELAASRIASELPASTEAAQHTRLESIKQGIFSVNVWCIGISFLFINIAVQGAAVFLPTVIGTLFPTKTTIQKQLLAVPPYFFASFMQATIPFLSMRYDKRAPFMMFHAALAIAGYGILVGAKSKVAKYVATFLLTGGTFPFGAYSPGLTAINTAPDSVRAMAIGLVAAVGNTGGIISVWTYISKDAPNYKKGNTLNLAGMIIVFALTAFTWAYMNWENKKRDNGDRDHRLEGLTEDQAAMLGHKHPKYRYRI
ncbi:putative pantothenate transporter [Meredithblackwellia eburnea MCA 4105]